MFLANTSKVESVGQFITVLILFLFVLLLTYYTTRWVAGVQKGKISCNNLEVIDTHKITPNKYVQIIRVGEKYIAIAICKDTITMLTELSKEELVLQEVDAKKLPEFKDVFEQLMKRAKKNENE